MLAGCAELGRRAVASVDEYDGYRRYRIAATLEQKLAAGYSYLRRHPRGHWHEDVRAWFSPAAERYVDTSWNDLERLRAFVQAVPEGPAASAAHQRLVELELWEELQARKELEFDEKITKMQARLQAAEAGRRKLLTDFNTWVKRLAAIRAWGARTSELDHELIYHYRLTDPEARCTTNRCKKELSVEYAIPESKAISARLALYDVVLELERGGLRRAILTGPDLFSRIGEAVMLKPVPPRNHGARVEALSHAQRMVEVAIAHSLPEARCAHPVVGATLVERRCDGVRFSMIAAIDPRDEDRVVVEPFAGENPTVALPPVE